MVKKILSRLFRVFVHVYIHHFDRIAQMGSEAHVNTCYKHFYYFVKEFGLIDTKELEPLVSRGGALSPGQTPPLVGSSAAGSRQSEPRHVPRVGPKFVTRRPWAWPQTEGATWIPSTWDPPTGVVFGSFCSLPPLAGMVGMRRPT